MPKKKAKDRRKSTDVKNAGASQLANSKSLSKSKKNSQPEEPHHFVHHRHHHSSQSEDGTSTLSNTPEPLSPELSPISKSLESKEIVGSGAEVEVVKLDVQDQVAGPDSAEPLPLGSEYEIRNLSKTESQMTDSFESASGRSLSSNSLASDVDIVKGYSLSSLVGFENPIREEPDSIPMVESIADIKEELKNKSSSDNPLVTVKVSEAFIEELKKEGEKNEEKPAETASLEKVQGGESNDSVKSEGEKRKEILPTEEESVVGTTSAETEEISGNNLIKRVSWLHGRSFSWSPGNKRVVDDVGESEIWMSGEEASSSSSPCSDRWSDAVEDLGNDQSFPMETLKDDGSEFPALSIPKRSFTKLLAEKFESSDSMDRKVQRRIKQMFPKAKSIVDLNVNLLEEIALTPPSSSPKSKSYSSFKSATSPSSSVEQFKGKNYKSISQSRLGSRNKGKVGESGKEKDVSDSGDKDKKSLFGKFVDLRNMAWLSGEHDRENIYIPKEMRRRMSLPSSSRGEIPPLRNIYPQSPSSPLPTLVTPSEYKGKRVEEKGKVSDGTFISLETELIRVIEREQEKRVKEMLENSLLEETNFIWKEPGGSLGKEGCRKEDLQSNDFDGKSTLEKETGDNQITDGKVVKENSPSPPRYRYPCFWMGWWFSRCFDSDDER